MREYKFRGKQLEDIHETANTYASEKGTWRYGTYKYIHKFFGGVNAHMICDIYGREIMCDKNTIGQFTGLHDKNGKEIYEGDVLYNEEYNRKRTVVFGKIGYDNAQSGLTGFAFEEQYCDDDGERFYELYYGQDYKEWEVIGNIHEVKE